MDTPLYKLYLFKRTARYFALPTDQYQEIRARMSKRAKELGIRDLFNASMSWSNERYEFFGVELYPSLEAVQAYTQTMSALGYFQYIEGESFLGIPMDGNYPDYTIEPAEPEQNTVYRLYFTRTSEQARLAQQMAHRIISSQPGGQSLADYAWRTPRDELGELTQQVNEMSRHAGIVTVLNAYMRWNNEGWEYFGIERFPNMETLIGYSQYLSSAGWYRLTEARSYLGTAYGGIASGIDDTDFDRSGKSGR